MKVVLKKNLTVGKLKLLKHQEGVLISIERNLDKNDGDYIYRVDFPKMGILDIPQKEIDFLKIS